MKKRLPVFIIIALIAASAVGYVFYTRDRNPADSIIVSGNIEVTDIRISFKIPGRIDALLVDEGNRVAKGQIVARLENSDQMLAVKQARANMEYSRAVLKEMETGSRNQEIAGARAEMSRAEAALNSARAQLKLAKSDRDRFKELFCQGGISLREYEEYETKYTVARNASEETQARLESARQNLSLVEEGARSEKIDQARSQFDISQENLREAELQLEYTHLYSPIDGLVLSKSAESGEYLSPGSPVITIGDLSKPWVRAYVKESDLGRIKLNQTVEVTTDTYPDKTYEGRISFISSEAEFTPKSVQTHDERVKLMYRIKISLDNIKDELKPGMPADALITIADR